jgi:hypothetical protein
MLQRSKKMRILAWIPENHADMVGYKYSSLDNPVGQIRLFKIEASNPNDVPSGSLEIFDLQRLPPYIALSYTWGTTDNLKAINIQGQPYTVRRNLFEFLETYSKILSRGPGSFNLSKPLLPYLWIDQLCINQKDTRERSSQTRMMCTIYQQAALVVAWLENAGRETDDAFFAIEQLRPQRHPLLQLASHQYWSRLWIVQELLLAKIILVVTKNWTLPFAKLSHYHLHWGSDVDRPGSHDPPITDYHHLLRLRKLETYIMARQKIDHEVVASRLSFDQAIRQFCDNKCADSRDKVYGLLGVMKDEQIVRIDYTKSVRGVFDDAIRVMVGLVLIQASLPALHEMRKRVAAKESIISSHSRNTLLILGFEMGVGRRRYGAWLFRDIQRISREEVEGFIAIEENSS